MKIRKQKRTKKQNDAIHLYLEQVAGELQNQGQTLQGIIEKIEIAEIIPTEKNLKEVIWRSFQDALLKKKSTTELTTDEVTKVYEVVAMFLSRNFEINLPFPSIEEDEPLHP
jgi:type I restriction-modification system DNA methylase subunit